MIQNNHNVTCQCADCKLKRIDVEREALHARLKRLDAIEREVLGIVPETTETN